MREALGVVQKAGSSEARLLAKRYLGKAGHKGECTASMVLAGWPFCTRPAVELQLRRPSAAGLDAALSAVKDYVGHPLLQQSTTNRLSGRPADELDTTLHPSRVMPRATQELHPRLPDATRKDEPRAMGVGNPVRHAKQRGGGGRQHLIDESTAQKDFPILIRGTVSSSSR